MGDYFNFRNIEKTFDRFTFLYSYFEAAQGFSDNIRLAFYEAVIIYGLYGKSIRTYGRAKKLFESVKPDLDANINANRPKPYFGEPKYECDPNEPLFNLYDMFKDLRDDFKDIFKGTFKKY